MEEVMKTTNVTWNEVGKSILYTNKYTGKSEIFSVGDVVTHNKRPEDSLFIVITCFTGKNLSGPIGFEYSAWRTMEHRWANIAFSLAHGNLRHVICYPVGYTYYGTHIDWSSLEHVDSNIIDHPNWHDYIRKIKSN
jgi:hypothetical protein